MSARPDHPPSGSPAALAVSVGSLAAAATLAIGLRWGRPGNLEAVGFAAAVCLVAAVAGWLVARRATGGPAARVGGALGTVFARTLPALLALGWLQGGGHGPGAMTAGSTLVVFYLVMLAADVIVNIGRGRMGSRRRPSAAAENRVN